MARETKKRIDPVDVEKYLNGMEFPAFRDDLVNYVIERGAPEEIIMVLERVPDVTYDDTLEVLERVVQVE